MICFPAIDLRGGKAVRLLKGSFGHETVYDDDPLDRAHAFEAAGASWVHVVDLDGARSGAGANRDTIGRLSKALRIPIQVGGGIRTEADAAELLEELGVARIILGTAAVEHPELVETLCRRYPGQVAVGLDGHGADVAVRGWEEASGSDLFDLSATFDTLGVAALIVTEIGVDGTMQGPAIDQLSRVLAVTSVDVIASGGVGTLADLKALRDVRVGTAGVPRRLAGVIVGRAIYESRFTVQQAVAACSE